MAKKSHTLQQVAAMAVCLTTEDKIRLIEVLAAALERDLAAPESDAPSSQWSLSVDQADADPALSSGEAAL